MKEGQQVLWGPDVAEWGCVGMGIAKKGKRRVYHVLPRPLPASRRLLPLRLKLSLLATVLEH